MSPSTALHDPIFRAYLAIVFGVLTGAGALLALLQFAFRLEVGAVWKTYCSWLWMTPLVAFFIFAGRIPFVLAVTVVSLLGCKEFARVSGLARDHWMTVAVYAAILLVPCGSDPIFGLLLIFLVPILRNRSVSIVAGGGESVARVADPGGGTLRTASGDSVPSYSTATGHNIPAYSELQRISLGVIAFILLGWMWGDLRFLANSRNVYGYLCYLIFATGVTDVAGFVFGKMFGRHPLRSRISPHKTWEGALGALAISVALPWMLRFSFPFFGPWQLVLTGLIVGLGGQLGDLAFSVLKRDLGVKNWSAAIPGHGGVLDRIDSLIFVAPLFMLMAGHYYPGR